MKKFLAISTMMLVFCLGSACADKNIIPVTGINPKAQQLLNTLTVIASTVESIGQTATAYSFTPTPSHTPPPPTKVPDPDAIRNLLSDKINGKLVAILGAKITIVNVSFGPIGAQGFTELYIEVNCESENNSACPSRQVVAVLVDACKDNKKKIIENIPGTTQLLAITIYDPGHKTQIVEADWSHVLAYINGDIPAEIFSKLIRYTQY